MIFNCKIFIKDIETPLNLQYIYNDNNKNETPTSLLEVLKKHNIPVNYQCRSGYCGSCRIFLIQGNIHYYSQPLASIISSKEIFTCCCYPITNIVLKI